MKIRSLPLFFLFSLLIPLLSVAEEYVLRQSIMREVSPVEVKSTIDADSTEIYYVSSAPLTDRDYPTIVYDYPDSADAELHWEAEVKGNTAIIHVKVTNPSTMQSALRPPVLGYTERWKNSVGRVINDYFSTGWGSAVTQTFYLTETVGL